MRCRNAQQLASRDLDGRLGADERSTLQAHLAGCAECRHFRARLQAMFGIAPEALPGGPDLWPAIVARLEAPPRRFAWLLDLWQATPGPLALAASIVLMVGAGLAAGSVLSTTLKQPQGDLLAFGEAFGDLPAGMPDLLGDRR
jgi:anti-sigma factor RsiW